MARRKSKSKATRSADRAAIEIGRKLAEATLKRRAKAIRTRSKALGEPKARAAGPKAKAVLAKTPKTHASAGVIVAEGDSWFDYPLHDVLSDLEDMYGFDVESVAHHGDTVENMAYSDGQLDDFSRAVEKVIRTGVTPRAILLSGGGNDVAGDEFAILLNHAASNISGLNESVVSGIIDQRVRASYVTILSAITAVCAGHLGNPVPILVHGYDYPVPDGRGFLGGWGPLPGPWLEPGFRRKGYQDMSGREEIMVTVIDRFCAMLEDLVGRAPFSHVKFVDLRNTLDTGRAYRDWWANELHPTPKGFRAVTRKFEAAL